MPNDLKSKPAFEREAKINARAYELLRVASNDPKRDPNQKISLAQFRKQAEAEFDKKPAKPGPGSPIPATTSNGASA